MSTTPPLAPACPGCGNDNPSRILTGAQDRSGSFAARTNGDYEHAEPSRECLDCGLVYKSTTRVAS